MEEEASGSTPVEEEDNKTSGSARGEVETGGIKDTSDSKAIALPRAAKLVLYGLAAVSSYLVMSLLSSLFGPASEGFPSFEMPAISGVDYLLMLLYIPIGILLCGFFEASENLSGKVACKIPVCVRETLCGIAVGCVMIFMPLALFSGEEEMREFMAEYGSYTPLLLIGVCFLKLFMTGFCIRFGLKGGHFFPVIFSCVLMGFGLSCLIFPEAFDHAVFAGGIITAAALGAQLKKPLAAAVLLLLCFPARLILWLILAAAAGSAVSGGLAKRHTTD